MVGVFEIREGAKLWFTFENLYIFEYKWLLVFHNFFHRNKSRKILK